MKRQDPQTGVISYVNHQKQTVIIEYNESGKKKNISASIKAPDLTKLKHGHTVHNYMIGDHVQFTLEFSAQSKREYAGQLKFLYNEKLDTLIQKAQRENRFTGYLKKVNDEYFIKEIETFYFVPIQFSSWQILPMESELNEQVEFFLENLDKKEKISASLFTNKYIPDYYPIVKKFKSKEIIESTVNRITPFAVYVEISGPLIQSKISLEKHPQLQDLKPGDKQNIKISFLSKSRIVVEPV